MAAAALALTALAAACSSSPQSGGNGSTPPASSSPGAATSAAPGSTASGSPISIGVMCSCSGAFGTTISDADKVVHAWAESVNAAGGLDGHPVQLIDKDNGSNPATAATEAQGLVAAKVSLVFDLDILDTVWQKTVDAAKIPVVGGAFTSEPFYTDPLWYSSGETNDSIVQAVIKTAKTAGAANMGLLYCAESIQCQQSVAPIEAAAKSGGVPVVYSASIAATAPNYTAQCLAAKQAGVKSLFIGDSISIIARVANDCDKQGYDPIYVTEGTGFQDLALTAPGLKDNLWSPYPVLPFFSTAAPVKAMDAVLDKYYPGITSNAQAWSEFAVQAWTGGLLLQAAAKDAGWSPDTTVTAADWVNALNKVSDDNLGGFSPTLTFTAGKPHPVDCWYTARVQNGVAKQVGGQTCQSAS